MTVITNDDVLAFLFVIRKVKDFYFYLYLHFYFSCSGL